MARMRSPSYPSIPLGEAIELVDKIHSENRTNIIDRESAVRDMGYSGLSGRALSMLAALTQYGLISKAGKGQIKVTQIAVDILHSVDPEDADAAILRAAKSPRLFEELHERFTDGIPSENAIRSYLVQQDFADAALGPAIKSFIETNHFIENMKDSDSSGDDESDGADSKGSEKGQKAEVPPPPPPPPAANTGGYQVMDGERVVFSEEVGIANHLKLIASGEMNVDLLDALSDFIKRQKKRLGGVVPETQSDDETE